MRIWLIQIGEMLPLTPFDRRMRTAHLATELAKRGHQVTWWSSAFDHMTKQWITNKNKNIRINDTLEIKLIKSLGYRKNVSIRRYLDHWWLAIKFKNQIDKEPIPDIIVSSLPDHHLAYQATRYALKHQKPIVIDLRDLWPALFVDMIKQPFLKKLIRILLIRDYWKTRFSLRNAHSLVTMMQHYLDIGCEQRKKTKNDRVFYLGAEKSKIKEKKNIRENINNIILSVKGKFVVLYIGTFNRICHPTILIDSAKFINQKYPHRAIEFILAGDGEYLEKLKKMSSNCPHVKFTGWINNDEIAALLDIASVGIVTTNEPFVGFINKVFTYLSGGLPIISSLEGEVKELINTAGLGYSYQYDQKEDLIEKILLLESSKDLRHKMAANAKKIFENSFNSKKIYSSYADHIERIALTENLQSC